ncbi:MAG: hypothetical protein GQ574_17190 [Crocinitomix sp.]|nr:hypothetical protein [Crocinitomix sp.]
MLEFVNGNDIAEMSEEGWKINYSMNVREIDATYLVDIPALNIHFYVDHENEIKRVANQSVKSFFNFWQKKNEFQAFIEQMLNLGFEIKTIGQAARKTKRQEKKDIGRVISHNVVLSYA